MTYRSVTGAVVRLVRRVGGPMRAPAWVLGSVVLAAAYVLLVPVTLLLGLAQAVAADGRNQIALSRAVSAGARGVPAGSRSGPPQW